MRKLSSKGKHTAKVGNHPHTNMIPKPAIMRRGQYRCRILQMHLKLRDQQLKTTCICIYRLLYQNLMVMANQKQIKTQKKKASKHNTIDSHQITREENKGGREEKRPTKTNPKQLTKWQ